nr:proline--tRNA ligase [bacterium]
MAKQDKGFVQEITPRDRDFAQWYTDVILKTDLVDYAPVRGFMVIKPYGYRIWELIQSELDGRFKATGHQNCYFPLLIPESLLRKEAEHVEGFAPEVAWVTHGGNEELSERLLVRPTSETLFCSMYAKWVQSYRDLPMLYNQWCSVVRWEKSTRPFLRTSEFLWQEGHTIHATADEAQEETMRMLNTYYEFAQNVLAIPMLAGQKTEKEKFAGARATYTIEAMMQDGKSLQSGTSHNFGTNFAEAFDIRFQDENGQMQYVHETSWGTSTRLIGALVMVHGDDRGLVLPPRVAPIQAVILPIAAHKGGVLEAAEGIRAQLADAGIRVQVDDRDYSAGWKFNEWEMKGVPVRIEVGPRDLAAGQVTLVRRDTLEKTTSPIEGLADTIRQLLQSVHDGLYQKALALREAHTTCATTMEQLEAGVQTGMVKAMWCGDQACEDAIKQKTTATARAIPFEQEHLCDTCVVCGKKAKHMVAFAKAY